MIFFPRRLEAAASWTESSVSGADWFFRFSYRSIRSRLLVLRARQPRMRIYVEHTAELPFSAILQAIRTEGWHVTHMEYLGQEGRDGAGSILDLQRTGRESDGGHLLETLCRVPGILFVEDV